MQTPAERRAAQRRLAKNLKEGKPTLPPELTRKGKPTKSQLINEVEKLKKQHFNTKDGFNAKRSRKVLELNADEKPVSSKHLRLIKQFLTDNSVFSWDDWLGFADEHDVDESALYYK